MPTLGFVPIASVTFVELSDVTTFPFASSTLTVTAGEIEDPATTLEGCCVNANFVAVPGT